jgi:hypothetical protein
MTIQYLELALWAATIPLLPYTLIRKKYDLFCGLLIAFWMLGIGIMSPMQRLGEYCRCP